MPSSNEPVATASMPVSLTRKSSLKPPILSKSDYQRSLQKLQKRMTQSEDLDQMTNMSPDDFQAAFASKSIDFGGKYSQDSTTHLHPHPPPLPLSSKPRKTKENSKGRSHKVVFSQSDELTHSKKQSADSTHSSSSDISFDATNLKVTSTFKSTTQSVIECPSDTDTTTDESVNITRNTMSVGFGSNSATTPLSYMATLELYRMNAKNSNSPEIRLAFAKYLLDAAAAAKTTESSTEKKGMTFPGALSKSASKKDTKEDISSTLSDSLLAEGHKWLKRLATQSTGLGRPPLAEAQAYLAECHRQGLHGFPVDYDRAFAFFIGASKQNHAEACYQAASAYEMGQGTKKDAARSVQFYRKAAALGYPMAMHRLGLILQNGELGQTKNPRESLTWLKRAAGLANTDSPKALYDLALCYVKGGSPAVIPDEGYALSLFTKAAQMGFGPAQVKLGLVYEKGLYGATIRPVESIEWYKKAAAQSYPEAEMGLSGWYLTGAKDVLLQSDGDAFHWALLAAKKKFPKGEFTVGHYTENGIGVRQDLETALEWYLRAAEQGNRRASNRIEEIKKLVKAGKIKLSKSGSLKKKKNQSSECSVM